MDPRPLTSAPDASLRWQVPGAGDRWDENFSDRLRVVEVRAVIFGVAPGPRGVPLQTPLRALGLLGGPRCVAELDGHVSLAQCHASPQPGSPAIAVEATPAYLVGQPRDRLTWVVELEGTPVVDPGKAPSSRVPVGVAPLQPASPAAGSGSGLTWQGFRWVGAGTLLGTLVPLGDEELIVAASDREGRLYVSRFNHARGVALAPVFGQRADTWHWPPFRPTLAVFR